MNLDDPHFARRYAESLLARLGLQPLRPLEAPSGTPLARAVASGWATLTGPADGAPVPCPAPLAACADGALAALAAIAPAGALQGWEGAALLGERAAAWGQSRQGLTSPGGSCRLWPTADGWLALNRPRPEDAALLPAWLGLDAVADDAALGAAIAAHATAALIEQGRLLGLAVAPEQALRPAEPWRWQSTAQVRPRPSARPLRVLDCSALWAGPLCAQLLRQCGAEVVKLESRQRLDGARRGPPLFYARLNAGKRSVCLDFATDEGRAQLRALAEAADLILEASRPRALRQLGLSAEDWLSARPGRTWLRLRGYGVDEDPEGQAVAYGDDAGVAAGLSWLMAERGSRWLVGDAIGDPLAGLHAALVGWAAAQQGGGLVEVALVDGLRHAIGVAAMPAGDAWQHACARLPPVEQWPDPRLGHCSGVVREAGADTAAVFRDWGLRC